MIKKSILFIILVVLLNTFLIANQITKLDKVSLQLQWKHQFEFAGFYMAKEKGFYKNIGLDVEIKEFTFDTDIVRDVQIGKSTYGTNYPSVVLDKSNGADIVLMSAILQLSPHVLISLKSSGINSIKDFKNKRIMIGDNAIKTASFRSMLKSNNLSLDDMIQLKNRFNINDLIDKRTDITTVFKSNELYYLDKQGIEYNIWDPKDYEFDFYDVILFTSQSELDNNPQRVQNFNEASLKGWRYAFDNIEETVDLILKKYNTQNRTKEALIYEAKALKELAYFNVDTIGDIRKQNIRRIYDMYNIMGLTKEKIDFDSFIYKNKNKTKDLTKKEKLYLKNKGDITMCIDPDWMPFEMLDKKGNHIGMSRDYFDIFRKNIDIPIDVIKTKSWVQTLEFAKQRECDIISLAMQTPNRKQYMNFTTPYLSVPVVLVTTHQVSFVDNIKSIKNKRVGIVEGYALSEVFKEKYTNINIIDVKNIKDGLEKVENGELYGFIGSISSIGYMFQTNNFANLKITGKFDERWELGVAVRNDDLVLLNIFNKLVNIISQEQKQTILNKYIAIKYEKGIDYTLLKHLSIGFIITLLILTFFLLREKKLRKKIEDLNENLELKIIKEVKKNRDKDKAFFRQAKLASMGEMIANIAHQWRQPLNRINLSLAVIDDIIKDDIIDGKLIEDKIKVSQKNLQYMSDTIEDFSNFFRADKKLTKFDITNTFTKVIELLNGRINNIDVVYNKTKVEISSYENEFIQVFLVIVNNALDNFLINNIENPKIEFKIDIAKDKINITICDNGGGISDDIIHNIFEPYFTTKFKEEGTGIGLYMAVVIVEDSIGGSLDVECKGNKTIFKIEIK